MKFQSLDNWLYEDIAKGRRPIDNQKRDYYGCLMLQAKVKDWEDFHTAELMKMMYTSNHMISPMD